MSRPPAYRHPVWFDRPVHRLRLITDLRTVGTSVTAVPPARARRSGFAIQLALTPHALALQQVTIEFSANSPNAPHVTVPGPGSPHRYDDGSLCIWYPHDPPEQRWTWRDGGAALAGHICVHLVREAWWRQSGGWVGDEASHPQPQTSTPCPLEGHHLP